MVVPVVITALVLVFAFELWRWNTRPAAKRLREMRRIGRKP